MSEAVREPAYGQRLNRSVRLKRTPLAAAVILLALTMIFVQVAGFIYATRQQSSLVQLRNDTREMRMVQQALVDEKESVEDYLLTDDAVYLQRYLRAAERLEDLRGSALVRLNASSSTEGLNILAAFHQLEAIWSEVLRREQAGQVNEARALAAGPGARALVDRVRVAMSAYIDMRDQQGDRYERQIEISRNLVLVLQVVSGLLALGGLLGALRLSMAREQVECLFDMADVLQSAAGYEDAKAVLSASAFRLLPHLSGSLYVFNNSRDRLELLTKWNQPADDLPPETISPASCWSIKRGKPHVNSSDPGAVRCAHHQSSRCLLEMPMAARGEIYGLLTFSAEGRRAKQTLLAARPVITALADGMSLALSNIALRERLRNQALRDPLTGLYNRRYMEDMLQRLTLLTRRDGRPVSVLMIDLDHFKSLNDEHGHPFGDTVLRGVATTITGMLREEDVACRYGGEELTVLLPGCSIDDAVAKAEMLRSRIEALSEVHSARISASIGVSAAPECGSNAEELIALADAALYEAKASGRNRVCAHPNRRSHAQLESLQRAA